MESTLKRGAKAFIKRYGAVIAAMVVIFTLLSIVSPYFLTSTNMVNLLRQLNTNALLAFGITFVLTSGCVDLSLGAMVAFGSVVVALLMRDYGIGFAGALLLTLIIASCIGYTTGSIVSRTAIPPFIATLAMQYIIRGAAYILSDSLVIKVDNEQFLQLGNGKLWGIPYPTLIFIGIGIIMSKVLTSTSYGRHLLATGGNIEAAVYSGINVGRVRRVTYITSAVLAALAGIILGSRAYSGQPTLGVGYESDAIAAAVLGGTKFGGGKGSIFGTFMGVIVIGLIANGMNLLDIGTYYQQVVKGLIILVAVFIDTQNSKKNGGI